jgi:hypothetical protein
MAGKFRKFGELSFHEQLLFSEALFLQVSIGLLLKIIPFRWVPKLFSGGVKGTGYREDRTSDTEPGTLNMEPGILNLIKTAIQRSGPCSPWKNRCLVSSLAARSMLQRRKIGSQISLGVAKDDNGRVIAHAWLRAGKIEIVPKGGNYQELYLF